MPYKIYEPDTLVRKKIKECCKNIFINHMPSYNNKLTANQKNDLLELFASWVDYAIPLSILEGLADRFDYYNNVLHGWSIRQVHSADGYWWHDNFKVFALLAKRKKALLFVQDDGSISKI